MLHRIFKRVISQIFKSCGPYLPRIRKTDKVFARKLDFKDKKFPVKIRDLHKIEKKNFGCENKKKFSIYVLKNTFKRNVDLLLIEEEGQSD